MNTMISRINTMNPMIPPPVPYFHAFSCTASVDIGAASAEAARRRKLRAAWKVYIFADLKCVDSGREFTLFGISAIDVQVVDVFA